MEVAYLDLDDPVDIREYDGRIVIEPIRPNKYDHKGRVSSCELTQVPAKISVLMGKQ